MVFQNYFIFKYAQIWVSDDSKNIPIFGEFNYFMNYTLKMRIT